MKSKYILSSFISIIVIIALILIITSLKFTNPFVVINYFFIIFFSLVSISTIVFYNCVKNNPLNNILIPFVALLTIIIITGINVLSFYLLLSLLLGVIFALFYRLDLDYDDIYFFSFATIVPIQAFTLFSLKHLGDYDVISNLNYSLNKLFFEWTYFLKNIVRSSISVNDTAKYILEVINRIRVNFLENFMIFCSLTFFLLLFFLTIVLYRAYSDSATKYNLFSHLRVKSQYIWILIIGLLFVLGNILFKQEELGYFGLTIYFVQGIALIIFFNLEKFYNIRTLLILLVIFTFLVFASKGLCYGFMLTLVVLYGFTDNWIDYRRLKEPYLKPNNRNIDKQ